MKSRVPLLAAVGLSALFLATPKADASLILTAIYDGSSSSPKGVEIYVTSTGSYDGWTVDLEFNANVGFNTSYTFDTTSYTAGDFIYLTSTATDAVLTGLSGPTVIISNGSFNMNGNDRVRLTDGTNVIDQYGASGTDGTGEAWEYLDSYAVRVSNTTPTGAFEIGDWTVAPINTLDPGNAPLEGALGTYTLVPEPSIALLGGLGLLGLLRRRR